MNNPMVISAFVLLVTWGFVIVAEWFITPGRLFYRLMKQHPAYYTRVGSPTLFLGIAGSQSLPRARRGQNYVYALAARGLPADFPKDAACRQFVGYYAKRAKYLPWIALAWGVGVFSFGIGIAIYMSTHA